MPGWDSPGFNDASWQPASVVTDQRNLVADVTAGVQVIQELNAKTVKHTAPGTYVFDLGQNMVGWARLTLKGDAGSTATLRFAEVLNPDGTPYFTNLRGAKATDQYTFKGGAAKRSTSRASPFTGFAMSSCRASAKLPLSARSPASSCTRPHRQPARSRHRRPMINQLQSNIVWGQKGNFVSVPTDCPQRDERLGWMGDAHIFVRTATFNMDVASFFTKWTRDVDDGQTSRRRVRRRLAQRHCRAARRPGATPASSCRGRSTWPTATRASSKSTTRRWSRWVEYIRGVSTNNLWHSSRGNDYGDWLSIADDTDKAVLGTAFYAHSADLVARARNRAEEGRRRQEVLRPVQRHQDSLQHGVRRGPTARSRATPRRSTRSRCASTSCPTTCAARRSRSSMQAWSATRGHLSTGFVGVSHLLPALTSGGNLDRVVPTPEQRHLSVVGLRDHQGRHDDLGALGRHRSERPIPGSRR